MNNTASKGATWIRAVAGPLLPPVKLRPNVDVVIGRGADCALRLEEIAVSRRHAMLTCHDGQWSVEDLDSAHGTYVNGARLIAHEPIPLREGDHLRINAWTFLVQSDDRPLSTTSSLADSSPLERVEEITDPPRPASPHETLDFLLAGARTIHAGADETGLVRAIADVLEATGVERCAVIRQTGSIGDIEIVCETAHDRQASPGGFRRELVETASTGAPARVVCSKAAGDVTSAICAPVVLDTVVWGYLYANSIDGAALPEDAAYLVQSIASIASQAIGARRRAEVHRRVRDAEENADVTEQLITRLERPIAADLGPFTCASTRVGRGHGALFDVTALADDRWLVIHAASDLGGVDGSLHLCVVLTNLRARARDATRPAELVKALRRHVADYFPTAEPTRLFVAIVDRAAGRVSYVNSGVGAIIARNERIETLEQSAPVRWNDAEPVAEHEADMPPGARLISVSGAATMEDQPTPPWLTKAVLGNNSPHDDVVGAICAAAAPILDGRGGVLAASCMVDPPATEKEGGVT